jgi:hypothetical protein
MACIDRKRLILLAGSGVVVLFCLSSCGDAMLPNNANSNGRELLEEVREFSQIGAIPVAKPTIPVRWTLTDLDGRTVDAMIVGRNDTSITLVRTSDGKRFELAMDRLSESDRKRVGELDKKTAPTKHPMESSLYRMSHAKLDDIDQRISELTSLVETSNSVIKRRSSISELIRLNAERGKILQELRELERF